jgi:PAS domain S-box-containing protein
MSIQSRKLQPKLFYVFGSKSVLFAMCLMAACTFLLFYIDYQREKERALESVQGKFAERLTALDRAVDSAEASVVLMRKWAESYLTTAVEQTRPSPLLKMLRYHEKGDYFELSTAEKQSDSYELGNIFGLGRITGRSHLFQKELNLAADILPLLRASQKESSVILQNYFFSNLKISSSYPDVSVSAIVAGAAPEGTLKDAFDTFYEPHAGLYTNPEGKSYWTDVYLDRTGHGLMVTYATPLYDGDRLQGLLAADITLGFLKRFEEKFEGPPGRLILATDHAKVLIDSAASWDKIKINVPILHDRLPDALRKSSSEILRGDMVGFLTKDGYYVFAQRLATAPWTFIHILDEDDLASYLSLTRVTFGIVVVVLTSFLVLAYFAVRQKKAEDALRATEKNYQEIFNATSEAIFIHDAKTGAILDVNQPMLDMFGYSYEEVLRLAVNELSLGEPPYSQKEAIELLRKAVDEGPQLFEWMSKKKDGKHFWSEVALKSSEIGGQGRVLAVVRDISDRKQAEKELLRYKSIVATANDLMSLLDRNYIYKAVNESYIKYYGKKREEIIGHSLEELIGEEDFKKTIKENIDRCFSGQKIHYQSWFQFPALGQRYMDVAYYPYYDESHNVAGAVVNARDFTEKKILEDRLTQAQKMEAIGTLAGGIAHDFNNLLSAIIGYTELSLGQLKEELDIKENLMEVIKAGKRAGDLVKQILAFSRQSELELRPIQIKPIIIDALKLLRALIPKTIEIQKNISSDATVSADPTQIHQVLMNLCANASHAMQENGGVLEVSLTDVMIDADFIAQNPEIAAGNYLRIRVSDSGCGMTRESMERIFNPFYTTKKRGKGTGMGLAVVHGIVKSHGGTINVSSEFGKGSVFDVYLPIIEYFKKPENHAEAAIPTGKERILFVDDEEFMVDLGKQMLEELGYQVTAISSSVEALDLFGTNSDKFDLVITDMTMPRMTGEKLAKELMNIRPDIPIVICTGYSESLTEESAKSMGIKEYAMKPLVMRDLAKIVRKVLDGG